MLRVDSRHTAAHSRHFLERRSDCTLLAYPVACARGRVFSSSRANVRQSQRINMPTGVYGWPLPGILHSLRRRDTMASRVSRRDPKRATTVEICPRRGTRWRIRQATSTQLFRAEEQRFSPDLPSHDSYAVSLLKPYRRRAAVQAIRRTGQIYSG